MKWLEFFFKVIMLMCYVKDVSPKHPVNYEVEYRGGLGNFGLGGKHTSLPIRGMG